MASRKTLEIPFLGDMQLRPNTINSIGEVLFTNGREDVPPNELQCKQYGYIYDRVSKTCRAYNFDPTYALDLDNIDNTVQGSNNTNEIGSTNSTILGDNNTNLGYSRNVTILGDQNTVQQNVYNSLIVGEKTDCNTNNTIIQGGNSGVNDILGARQLISLIYGKQTIDGSTKASLLNNAAASYWYIPINTAIFFNCEIVALRIGGSSTTGAIGDAATWVERGVVVRGATTTINRQRQAVRSLGTGTTSWRPTASIGGANNFYVAVKGATNMIVEWSISVRITQIKTNVTL
tara:strand:+ start:1912 stop:2781 length:870 start_codon:yes stop_codon:yes gene_type:complete